MDQPAILGGCICSLCSSVVNLRHFVRRFSSMFAFIYKFTKFTTTYLYILYLLSFVTKRNYYLPVCHLMSGFIIFVIILNGQDCLRFRRKLSHICVFNGISQAKLFKNKNKKTFSQRHIKDMHPQATPKN